MCGAWTGVVCALRGMVQYVWCMEWCSMCGAWRGAVSDNHSGSVEWCREQHDKECKVSVYGIIIVT